MFHLGVSAELLSAKTLEEADRAAAGPVGLDTHRRSLACNRDDFHRTRGSVASEESKSIHAKIR